MVDDEIEYVVPGPSGKRIKRSARITHVDEQQAKVRTVQVKHAKADGPTDLRSLMQRAREESRQNGE